jgi:hypothetical protein
MQIGAANSQRFEQLSLRPQEVMTNQARVQDQYIGLYLGTESVKRSTASEGSAFNKHHPANIRVCSVLPRLLLLATHSAATNVFFTTRLSNRRQHGWRI